MSKNGRYLELKANHKCVRCREQDDRTLAGRVLCAACNESVKEYHQRPEYKYAHRDRNNARYRRLQREHKCTQCGKLLAEGEYYERCASCRKKQSERQKEKWKKKKTAENGNSQTA
jgi:hypothetical protein